MAASRRNAPVAMAGSAALLFRGLRACVIPAVAGAGSASFLPASPPREADRTIRSGSMLPAPEIKRGKSPPHALCGR